MSSNVSVEKALASCELSGPSTNRASNSRNRSSPLKSELEVAATVLPTEAVVATTLFPADGDMAALLEDAVSPPSAVSPSGNAAAGRGGGRGAFGNRICTVAAHHVASECRIILEFTQIVPAR